MKLKIKSTNPHKHQEMATAVSWAINNEVYSISDDKIIYKWDYSTGLPQRFIELDQYPTDLDWAPITKGINDLLAVGFCDGKLQLITKLAKIEKSIEAHKGAIISLKWNSDGTALATGSEDGAIKIWSRTGNLRSQLIQQDQPIYCVVWNPENDALLFCCEKNMHIKPIQPSQKAIQWKAHEGVILKVDWNVCNNLIVSGGEDCRYKVWDSFGRVLYASNPYDYVITSVSWAPNGEYFAVGAYGMIKLCDKAGWTYSFEKMNVGSLMKLSWSSDSTICSGAGVQLSSIYYLLLLKGNGELLFGYIIDKTLYKDNLEVTLTHDSRITVFDLISDVEETLDFKER